MNATAVEPTAAPAPAALRDLLGVPFTDDQLAAATAPLEPGLVVAGAGSGKTSVMAARVVWLVATGQVAPEQVLGLTFTNKAAAELATRVRGALERVRPGADPAAVGVGVGGVGVGGVGVGDVAVDVEPTVSTYHAFAGRLLREHGLRIGLEPSARLLADATRFQVAERVLRRARGPFPNLEKGIHSLVGDLVALDGEISEHLLDLDDVAAEDARIVAAVEAVAKPVQAVQKACATALARSQLTSLVRELRAAKAERGVLDFGDQLAFAARLVATHPAVAEVERARFRVVLLDEYQDTSVAQRDLLLGLFGRGHPVTAVGDPFQAIYGWRGASVANIMRFHADFRCADGRPAPTFGLRQNNRSGGRLLDLANALAQGLREQHPDVGPLVPRPGVEHHGDTVCALLPTYADEVEWVADQVAAEVAGGRSARDVAVLVRVRSDFPAYHDALVARGIPVEVVGLGGLLALPEVADLVAMLEVLDDPTANAALVRLLSGPRWRIGPRDLALLGRRAAALVRAAWSGTDPDAAGDGGPAAGEGAVEVDDGARDLRAAGMPRRPEDVRALLEEAVEGVDPAEVVSLAEALERPGREPYSPQARERFARAAAELAVLRQHLGEPLLDLLHRMLATTGLDVEVGAAPYAPRTRRSDALAGFLDHAASFADLDGDPSVRAFLAFLRAADEFDRGLDTTAPSPSESVKLLTVHKAKGLEWPVVVLPDLTADVFPAARGRSRFTTSAATLPTRLRGDAASFPDVREWSSKGLQAFDDAMRTIDRLEELRLGYVAVTRAKQRLIASSHWWGPTQKRKRGPSDYLRVVHEHCRSGAGVVGPWAAEPADEANPGLQRVEELVWPVPLEPGPLAARREAAEMVRAAMAAGAASASAGSGAASSAASSAASGAPGVLDDDLGPDELTLLAHWDRDAAALLDEARRAHRVELDVALPASLSASALVRLASDPDGLARDLARPMPRPPAPAARRGTRFHAWVEAQFGQRPLLDRSDLEGAADDDLVPDEQMQALRAAFQSGPYATLRPHRMEAPFQLVLGGRVVRGRIDAVYARDDGGYDVVDWKTGTSPADPLQLAVYRSAWARIAGVPEERVGAAFYYVTTGRVDRPADLPSGAELERLLTGG